jgi:hypothetical protein
MRLVPLWLVAAMGLAACTSDMSGLGRRGSGDDLVADRKAKEDVAYAQNHERAAGKYIRDRDVQVHVDARCEAATTRLRGCQMIDAAAESTARFNCTVAMSQTWSKSYAQIHCFELALDCSGMRWCQTH